MTGVSCAAAPPLSDSCSLTRRLSGVNAMESVRPILISPTPKLGLALLTTSKEKENAYIAI